MNKDFYNKIDYIYPEIGICMEDTEGSDVKIAIPIATPTLPTDIAYDNKDLSVDTQNIVSDTTPMYIAPCITSNYITIKLPSEIESLKKGDKVILIFIGGDVNSPVILRRYDN